MVSQRQFAGDVEGRQTASRPVIGSRYFRYRENAFSLWYRWPQWGLPPAGGGYHWAVPPEWSCPLPRGWYRTPAHPTWQYDAAAENPAEPRCPPAFLPQIPGPAPATSDFGDGHNRILPASTWGTALFPAAAPCSLHYKPAEWCEKPVRPLCRIPLTLPSR